MELFTFGDMFSYLGDTYVYLASTGAAKVVKRKMAAGIIKYRERILRKGSEA